MMKKFLLVVCGSFVGVILALTFFVIATILFSLSIASMGGGKATSVEKHSILHLDLDGEIAERPATPSPTMADLASGSMPSEATGLNMLVKAIDDAATNDKIDGIYLECNGAMAAPATLTALRKALKNFKTKTEGKKFIYAFANQGYGQGDYYLASVADSLFVNPEGALDLHGMASSIPYLKRLMEKVGVEMQVVRVGTFKSAVEPYMLDSISPANRLQTEHYLGSIWGEISNEIAADRKIAPERLNSLVDSILITRSAQEIVDLGLLDGICFRKDFEKKLKALTEVDEDDDLALVSPSELVTDLDTPASGEHIAVLYAVGEIDDDDSDMNDDAIHGEKMVEIIDELAKDDNVKGLVLRVNSPGGSAFASEQIWKALDDFKAAGKPLAVSMGDYAASGGYYISSGAGRIFAEPTTITGSIGIFGTIPCMQELMEDKLGVHISVVKTNKNSDMGLMTKRLTPSQLAALQQMVNRGYDLFTKRCADGRGVSQDSIKVIAEGRVWDGKSALKIGLVDELGGLDEAIAWVANEAGLDKDCDTQCYPSLEENWKAMVTKMMNAQAEVRMADEMGLFYDYYKELRQTLGRDHVLCLMFDRVTL
ncbi:MAG: signal peptide peptidase SppA [Muribaculaceae bacterium]|nr:signal peptide peptidase SppA [Muribaculaceae bacterium]